jgi:hypothetical protein
MARFPNHQERRQPCSVLQVCGAGGAARERRNTLSDRILRKTLRFIIAFAFFYGSGTILLHAETAPGNAPVPSELELDFFRHYGPFTDPGGYEYLFDGLPDRLPELCARIKAQLIHPLADLPLYRGLVPPERTDEDPIFPTVASMLGGLLARNPAGLVSQRTPGERLVVSCRYHAILLASILKHRGIPARVRYGFASYLMPGAHIYHVICEVWNADEKRWMRVDPDRQLVDFALGLFVPAFEAWQKYGKDELDPSTWGFPGWWGPHPILDVMCHDLASVLGSEHLYVDRPPISANIDMDVAGIPADRRAVLDTAAQLLKDPDAGFNGLRALYDANPYLQFAPE